MEFLKSLNRFIADLMFIMLKIMQNSRQAEVKAELFVSKK